jgi:hypothetical protein
VNFSSQGATLERRPAVRMRLMPGRAIRVTARIAFLLCGLISLFTGVPYVMLRGAELPVQSEWVIFVVALGLLGVFSVTIAVLPRSWIAKACKQDRDNEQLFSAPLKLLGSFAAISYLLALVAYLAPHRWNLDPQLMLALCPLYFVKMTFDPSLVATFFLLAPLNAGGGTAHSGLLWDMHGWPFANEHQLRHDSRIVAIRSSI